MELIILKFNAQFKEIIISIFRYLTIIIFLIASIIKLRHSLCKYNVDKLNKYKS